MKNYLWKILDALGWLWCIPEELNMDPLMVKFIRSRVPLFWIMGPPRCGKTTIAEGLAERTGYDLIRCSRLIKEAGAKTGFEAMVIRSMMERIGLVTDEIIIKLLITELLALFENAKGLIIDGFPIDLPQSKEFIQALRKPSIIVFACLSEDDIMKRFPHDKNNAEAIVNKHNEWMTKMNQVYRAYERKTLKVITNKSPALICDYLINYLNAYYGYSFRLNPAKDAHIF